MRNGLSDYAFSHGRCLTFYDAAVGEHRDYKQAEEPTMGLATYAVIDHQSRWVVLHDGNPEGDFATKEAAFEAAVAAIREGHEVHVSAPGREAGNGTSFGAESGEPSPK